MKTKKILTILFIASLFSCNNRDDYFSKDNNPPQITISKGSIPFEGTIKDTIKLGGSTVYNYFIKDEEKNLFLSVSNNRNQDEVSIKKSTIEIIGKQEGSFNVDLISTDYFGAIGKRTLDIVVLKNLLPTSNFKVSKIGLASPNEIEVDASESFSSGEEIVLYEFDLHNYIVRSETPKVRYIFGTKGQKKITVKVQDNNGDWSPGKTQYFLID